MDATKEDRRHHTIMTLCEIILEQSHELEQIRERRAEAVRLNEVLRERIHELERRCGDGN